MSEKNSYVDSFKVIADFAQSWRCSPYQHNLNAQLQKARREIAEGQKYLDNPSLSDTFKKLGDLMNPYLHDNDNYI